MLSWDAGNGLWGDRKDSWGFFSFYDPQMEENFASPAVQVLQGWVNCGQGSPWEQLCPCPLSPVQGHMNLSCRRRVPDCHLPCDESRLPRTPLCSWKSSCGVVAEGLAWCWDSDSGAAVGWGQSVAQRDQQSTDTPKPFCTPWGDGRQWGWPRHLLAVGAVGWGCSGGPSPESPAWGVPVLTGAAPNSPFPLADGVDRTSTI